MFGKNKSNIDKWLVRINDYTTSNLFYPLLYIYIFFFYLYYLYAVLSRLFIIFIDYESSKIIPYFEH